MERLDGKGGRGKEYWNRGRNRWNRGKVKAVVNYSLSQSCIPNRNAIYGGIRRKSKKDPLPSFSAFNPGKGKQKRREKEMIGGEKKGLRIIVKK